MANHQLTGLRAVIHARESRFEARAGNRSTTEQVAESRAWCQQEGVVVAHVIVEEDTTGAAEGRSSRAKPRDKWDKTKRLLAHGDADGPLNLLVTWSSTRGQRDLEEYVLLRRLCTEAGVLWCYNGRVYDLSDGEDRFRTGVDALVGERDVEEIRKNVNRALRANRALGKPHGRVLYGYRRVHDETTGAFLRQELDDKPRHLPPPPVAALAWAAGHPPAPCLSNTDVVRMMFELYLAGHSTGSIARALNEAGVPTSTGRGKWVGGSVLLLLTNPGYIARLTHRGKDVGPGTWPALVDQRTWDRTQVRIAERRTPWDYPSPTKLLLTGLARCGVCLERMTRMPVRPGRPLGYVCKDGHVFRPVERLDLYMSGVLLERLATEEQDDSGEDPAVERGRRRLVELQTELDAAMAAWKTKRLSLAAYTEMEAYLLPQIAAAEQAVRRALVPLDIDIPPAQQQDRWWAEELTAEQRREVMAAWVVAVVVHPVGRGKRKYRDRDCTEIEWRR